MTTSTSKIKIIKPDGSPKGAWVVSVVTLIGIGLFVFAAFSDNVCARFVSFKDALVTMVLGMLAIYLGSKKADKYINLKNGGNNEEGTDRDAYRNIGGSGDLGIDNDKAGRGRGGGEPETPEQAGSD